MKKRYHIFLYLISLSAWGQSMLNLNPSPVVAFFAPDEKTEALMKNFTSTVAQGKKVVLKALEDVDTNFKSSHNFQVVFNNVDELPDGALASITPQLEKDVLTINVNFTEKGLANPAVIAEELAHLDQITGGAFYDWERRRKAFFGHPYEWVETLANAQAGSLQAKEVLARMELEAIKNIKGTQIGKDSAKTAAYLQSRATHAEELYQQVSKVAKVDLKRREAAWKKTKIIFDELEKNPVKFNDLVANNDRAGVRKMLTQYLPWDLMEPTEKSAWSEWLEAMEHPNTKDAQILFRGMDNDIVISAPSGQPGMLSTVLTKNQGSYTRRLRSLTTLREKIGTYKNLEVIQSPELIKVPGVNRPSLMTAMNAHAINPLGSPFLSLSNNTVAQGFGYNRRAAFLIDPRRTVPNGMAFSYTSEVESLVPLVIFPDEVVHYVDLRKDPSVYALDNNKFYAEIEAKIGRALTEAEKSTTISSDKFIDNGYERLKRLFLDPKKLPKVTPCVAEGSPDVFKTLDFLLK
jgi:hypothetical protein